MYEDSEEAEGVPLEGHRGVHLQQRDQEGEKLGGGGAKEVYMYIRDEAISTRVCVRALIALHTLSSTNEQ